MRGWIGSLSLFLFSSAAISAAMAEAPDPAAVETVSWTAAASPANPVAPASALKIALHAQVREGWHVYALKQLPGGPTPLRIAIEPNPVAAASGEPTGGPPVKVHDPSFDLDTPLYSGPFSVTLPVRVAAHAAPGPQHIPVSVRFQTCNGRICQPPKTIHLTAAVTIK